jgi:amino-acid N-acetyltransferase
VNVRPATTADVPAMHALIKTHAERGKMVLRPLDELYTNLRTYVVAELDGKVVGCASTHIFWSDLAELKGLAVDDAYQGRGVGAALCQACYEDMQRLGVKHLFALTNATQFFEKLGYQRIAKERLPRFIWGECVRCPSFPVCNEEAVIREVI